MANQIKVVPNILIASDDQKAFDQVKSFIHLLTGVNAYTVYKLDSKELAKNTVWFNYCKLLVQPVTSLQELSGQAKFVNQFLQSGGQVLTLSASDQSSGSVQVGQHSLKVVEDLYEFEEVYLNQLGLVKIPLVVSDDHSEISNYVYHYDLGQASGPHGVSKVLLGLTEPVKELASNEALIKIYCQMLESVFKIKCLSPQDRQSTQLAADSETLKESYYLYSKNELLQSVKVVGQYLREGLNNNGQLLPQQKGAYVQIPNFNPDSYFGQLRTKSLGHLVMFSDLVGSTMNTFDVLPSSINNLLVIARQQVKGQGANKNEWLSPIGCSMFTVYLNFSSSTFNPSRLCLLQFAAALSCVKAISKTQGLEELPVKLKWPNDVYFNKELKLGGILVRSSMIGSQQNVKIGVGFNLSNSQPTNCLNSELRKLNIPEWTHEEFIGKFVNEFEVLLDQLSSPKKDLNHFLDEYCQHWLHAGQRVVIESSDNQEAEVLGINEYGYLRVKKLQDGSLLDLQPDGNRFDMMQNLILLR